MPDTEKNRKFLSGSIGLLARFGLGAIEKRDSYTAGHCERVEFLSGKLFTYYLQYVEGKNLKFFNRLLKKWNPYLENSLISDGIHDEVKFRSAPDLIFSSMLHDIGKIGWPDDILNGKINIRDPKTDDSEKKRIKEVILQHPIEGSDVLFNAIFESLDPNEDIKYNIWLLFILFHHKYYDPTHDDSYPKIPDDIRNSCLYHRYVDNKKSFNIKDKKEETGFDTNFLRVALGILRLADEIDARTSPRSYRNGIEESYDNVVSDIKSDVNVKFHPDVVDVFLSYKESILIDLIEYKKDAFLIGEFVKIPMPFLEKKIGISMIDGQFKEDILKKYKIDKIDSMIDSIFSYVPDSFKNDVFEYVKYYHSNPAGFIY